MPLFPSTKALIKRSAAALLYDSGLIWPLARRRLHGRVSVLMYHRVLPKAEAPRSFSHAGMIVSVDTFRKHLDLLRSRFHPISLAQLRKHIEAQSPFPEGSCLVTFDDGWSDNHEHALPLLREKGVPAVVFAATGYVGTDRTFWQEHLGQLLYESARRRIGGTMLASRGIQLGDPSDDALLRSRVAEAVDLFRKEPYSEVDRLTMELSSLLRQAGHAECLQPRDRFMNWEQLRELSSNGVEVASHTCSHRLLTRLEPDKVRHELGASKAELEARLGASVTALAYPGGYHDDTIRRAAVGCGYRLGFTTAHRLARHDSDPLLMPRINIHEAATHTDPLFVCRVLGLL